MATPTKHPPGVRQNASESFPKIRHENSNPNLTSPSLKHPNSPLVSKSTKTQKSAAKNPNPTYASPHKKIRERKFVVAKKNNTKKKEGGGNCKCKDKVNGKCLCVAYENLRASQEEFFKGREGLKGVIEVENVVEGGKGIESITQNSESFSGCVKNLEESKGLKSEIGVDNAVVEPKGIEPITQKGESLSGRVKNLEENDASLEDCKPEEGESPEGLGFGSSTIKRRRDMLMEEARESVPNPGSGRVLHLVQAFERLLTIPKESNEDDEKEEEDTKQGVKWALPGLQQRPRAPVTEEESSSAFCPGELCFSAQSLGLESNLSTSLESSRGSISSCGSVGSRRSRRSSSFSSGTPGEKKWKKKKKQQKQQQNKVTSLRPFKLLTEQRGRAKEEEFIKKLQEMATEEEKQRIPIAQGLPWTTDEPECLIKPSVKECTRPIDLKLNSDMRAVDRAEFDHQVAEKLFMIEQYKTEREKQQKLEEEDEIRRLRKELVPKAQPMPYFDRPFVPMRSMKQPTLSKSPKFRFPHQKKIKCSLSWSDFNE